MRKKNLLFKIIPFLLLRIRIRSKVVRIRNTAGKSLLKMDWKMIIHGPKKKKILFFVFGSLLLELKSQITHGYALGSTTL